MVLRFHTTLEVYTYFGLVSVLRMLNRLYAGLFGRQFAAVRAGPSADVRFLRAIRSVNEPEGVQHIVEASSKAFRGLNDKMLCGDDAAVGRRNDIDQL